MSSDARVHLAGGECVGDSRQREDAVDERAPPPRAGDHRAEQREADGQHQLTLESVRDRERLVVGLLDDDRPLGARTAAGTAKHVDAAQRLQTGRSRPARFPALRRLAIAALVSRWPRPRSAAFRPAGRAR